MARLESLPGSVGEPWMYALLGGLASIPFTTAGYWETGSELSLAPVFGGALLAGYLAASRTGSSRGVGVRAGLIGGLPVIWIVVDLLAATSGVAGPAWFVGAATVFAAGFAAMVAAIGLGFAAMVGKLGGSTGGWLANRTGRQRSSATGS